MYPYRFPQTRLRRLRSHPFLRHLNAESHLSREDLILPAFVTQDQKGAHEIAAMPGVMQHSEDSLKRLGESCLELGVGAMALFPVVSQNDRSVDAWAAFDAEGLVPTRVRMLKELFPELTLIGDVALDPYTLSGQDGVTSEGGEVLNDETNVLLKRQALCLAQAGIDIIAPSDMMDGRVGVIRTYLDAHDYQKCCILSYAAKYVSNLYAPFREAIGSQLSLGKKDKSGYQMDSANSDEALRECFLDLQEGADMLLVKPAGWYLDVIEKVQAEFKVPVLGFQVSGEYSMLKMASQAGLLEEKKVVLESLQCMKRAGCRGIFTYYALSVAAWLR